MAVNLNAVKLAGFTKTSDGSWWCVKDNADYYLTIGSDGSWMLLIEYPDGKQVKRDGSRGQSLELVLDNLSRGRGGVQFSDPDRLDSLRSRHASFFRNRDS